MHIGKKHIQEWIRAGHAIVVAEDIAAQFGRHLDELPWLASGSGLDWTRLKGRMVDLSKLDVSHLGNWLTSVPVGEAPYIVFWYSSYEPGVACERSFAVSHLNEAFWMAPGKRYVFGAHMLEKELIPSYDRFAEYDGMNTLVAAM